jgi:hypothetical protein
MEEVAKAVSLQKEGCSGRELLGHCLGPAAEDWVPRVSVTFLNERLFQERLNSRVGPLRRSKRNQSLGLSR